MLSRAHAKVVRDAFAYAVVWLLADVISGMFYDVPLSDASVPFLSMQTFWYCLTLVGLLFILDVLGLYQRNDDE